MKKVYTPKETYIIIDVGCIECGEATVVLGIFPTLEEAQAALRLICSQKGIKHREPRGGMLELFTSIHAEEESSYIDGTGYYTRGQRALELHVFPARPAIQKGES